MVTYREQTVEITLKHKGAIEDGKIGTLTRRASVDQVVSAVPPLWRNAKPPKELQTPRVVELLRKAIEWQALLESEESTSQGEIANREGITRARVTQIMGMLHLASDNAVNLPKQDADFGQTLGVYGLGQGFYIHWPILGPSSPRDTVGLIGDMYLHPSTYLFETDVLIGIKAYERVNSTSLSIGDYESLKDAAVDPYVAIRDAYVQYRLKKIKTGGGKPAPSGTGGAISPAITEDPPAAGAEGEK